MNIIVFIPISLQQITTMHISIRIISRVYSIKLCSPLFFYSPEDLPLAITIWYIAKTVYIVIIYIDTIYSPYIPILLSVCLKPQDSCRVTTSDRTAFVFQYYFIYYTFYMYLSIYIYIIINTFCFVLPSIH